MYDRSISSYLTEIAQKYRAITLIGPRQSGKTTLSKIVFKEAQYFTMENPETRQFFQSDPNSFLQKSNKQFSWWIIDEVQRVPELFSFVQEILDDPQSQRRFVFTGSHNLMLMENISQSLAGRTRIVKILPMSLGELAVTNAHEYSISERLKTVDDYLFHGGYPRIFNENLKADEWLADYIATYVEKDLRSLQQISDLSLFERFLRLLAGRVGQLFNASSIGSDCGIAHTTAFKWLSLLETSFITFTLRPHHQNFGKRITKSPKVYFYDTGLLCHLLSIRNTDQLSNHPLRGHVFENFMVLEHLKRQYSVGIEREIYFWRDQKGHEIDLVIDEATHLYPIEIKSSATFHPSFLSNIHFFNKLQNYQGGTCFYTGTSDYEIQQIKIKNWRQVTIT